MRMQMFTMDPVALQPYGMKLLDEKLKGATHVETYTKDEGLCGGDRTLIIFAFYPDKASPEKDDEVVCVCGAGSKTAS